MKKKELIDAVEENNMLNEQIYFTHERLGIGHLPVSFQDNLILLILDVMDSNHKIEKVSNVKCTGQDIINHLNSYNNNLDLYCYCFNNNNDYVVSDFDFSDKDIACVYIENV